MVTMMKEKVNSHFSFPLRLDMSGYMESNLISSDKLPSTVESVLGDHPSGQSKVVGNEGVVAQEGYFISCFLMGRRVVRHIHKIEQFPLHK